jgi:hypothetical protein
MKWQWLRRLAEDNATTARCGSHPWRRDRLLLYLVLQKMRGKGAWSQGQELHQGRRACLRHPQILSHRCTWLRGQHTRKMLPPALDVGDDNIEGAPKHTPPTFNDLENPNNRSLSLFVFSESFRSHQHYAYIISMFLKK